MKRIANKTIGVVVLSLITQFNANAGFLSNFGQRLMNGVVNTVQNNIQRKVNRTVDNAMDGKIGNNNGGKKSTNTKNKSAAYVEKKAVESKVAETKTTNSAPSVYNGEPNVITYTNEKGKTIPFSNDYKLLDLGNDFKIYGEHIFNKELRVGIEGIGLEGFLAPGKYVVTVQTISNSDEGIYFAGKYQEQGIDLGYGIIVRKTISYNKGRYSIKGDNDGIVYFIEVLEGTVGHLEATMVNSKKLDEHGAFNIFKVPEYPTLPSVK